MFDLVVYVCVVGYCCLCWVVVDDECIVECCCCVCGCEFEDVGVGVDVFVVLLCEYVCGGCVLCDDYYEV